MRHDVYSMCLKAYNHLSVEAHVQYATVLQSLVFILKLQVVSIHITVTNAQIPCIYLYIVILFLYMQYLMVCTV